MTCAQKVWVELVYFERNIFRNRFSATLTTVNTIPLPCPVKTAAVLFLRRVVESLFELGDRAKAGALRCDMASMIVACERGIPSFEA
jgi:hypothetical protein